MFDWSLFKHKLDSLLLIWWMDIKMDKYALIRFKYLWSLAEGIWSVSFENISVSFLTCTDNSSENWKFDFIISVEAGSGSSDLALLVEDCSSDDGDCVRWGSVVTGHLCVELTDCTVQRHISVLFIHIVVSGSWFISKDNTESFDVIGPPLKDLIDCEDLTLGTLGLELTSKMVPEFGFGGNFISCEKSDGIYFGVGILFWW